MANHSLMRSIKVQPTDMGIFAETVYSNGHAQIEYNPIFSLKHM